jgi:hypothetical protein
MFQQLIQQLKEAKHKFSAADARRIGNKLGVNWKRVNLEQFRMGLEVESEHDQGDNIDVVGPQTDLGKIALAHLKELPDYYTRLRRMEKDANAEE